MATKRGESVRVPSCGSVNSALSLRNWIVWLRVDLCHQILYYLTKMDDVEISLTSYLQTVNGQLQRKDRALRS